MSQTAVKHTSVSNKSKKQSFMRQSRARKDNSSENKHRFTSEEELIHKQVVTPEDVILLPSITKGL